MAKNPEQAPVVPITSASRRVGGTPVDPLDALIGRVVDGDPAAWTELVDGVHRAVVAACARRRVPRAVADDDVGLDVARRVLDKLHADDFARLRRFLAVRNRYRNTDFWGWLSVVTRNAYVDHLRAVPELQRGRSNGQLTQVAREPFDDAVVAGGSVDIAAVVDARRAMARVAEGGFPPHQRHALSLWLAGCDAAEIAGELSLDDASTARRLLRAAQKRLHRMLRKDGVR